MDFEIKIDGRAQHVIVRLELGGFEAWLVGGCVRDLLCGQPPKDWDVATSARPEEAASCFPHDRILNTGRKHGTITVLADGLPVEVTTFRRDGAYLDNRRPARVAFVSDLETDLQRRDFTINAMAYHPRRGRQEPFGGATDLNAGILRAVGNPDVRLQEDGLRILRALRFGALRSLRLDPRLSAAIHRNKMLLSGISAERIASEIYRMLPGDGIFEILRDYADVLTVCIPEIGPAVGFDQKNPHHAFDVWMHTVHSVAKAAPDPMVRLVLLFHDLGKPARFFTDEAGVGHFYGHEETGAEMAKTRLRALRLDRETVDRTVRLVRWHDVRIQSGAMPRWLGRLGEGDLRLLFQINRADAAAHTEGWHTERFAEIDALEEELDQVLAEGRCFTLKELETGGDDLIALGAKKGPPIGRMLSALLEAVMDGRLPNHRPDLLAAAKAMMQEAADRGESKHL